MEHIVQFAFNFDDKAIQEKLEKSAYDQIIDRIYKDATKSLRYNYCSGKADYSKYIEDACKNLVEDHKEEIIEEAIKRVCRSITSSKAYKEAIKEAAKEL